MDFFFIYSKIQPVVSKMGDPPPTSSYCRRVSGRGEFMVVYRAKLDTENEHS